MICLMVQSYDVEAEPVTQSAGVCGPESSCTLLSPWLLLLPSELSSAGWWPLTSTPCDVADCHIWSAPGSSAQYGEQSCPRSVALAAASLV